MSVLMQILVLKMVQQAS